MNKKQSLHLMFAKKAALVSHIQIYINPSPINLSKI